MKKILIIIAILFSLTAFSQGKIIDSVLKKHTEQIAAMQAAAILPGVGLSVTGNKLNVDQQRTDSLVLVIKRYAASIDSLRMRISAIELWKNKPL